MKTDRDRWTVKPYRHGDRQGQMDSAAMQT